MTNAAMKTTLVQAGRNWLRNAAVYLAGGFVLFFASERVFWSTFREGDKLGDLAVTWLVYSVLACVFVNVVARFRVTTTARMFLAGALYGWLTEGTIVGTLYGTEESAPFPLSIVWTGLSWHALISVLVCWHFMGRALRKARPWKALSWAVALGVYWGLWAPFLWRETPPEVATVGAFAAHAFACTGLLAISHGVLLRFPATTIRPGWPGLALSLLGLGVFYSAQVKTIGLRPLVMLPLLVGAVLGLLWWSREKLPSCKTSPDLAPAAYRHLLTLLAIPVVASALYGIQLAVGTKGIAPIHFYHVCGLLAVTVLGWSIYQVSREKKEARSNLAP